MYSLSFHTPLRNPSERDSARLTHNVTSYYIKVGGFQYLDLPLSLIVKCNLKNIILKSPEIKWPEPFFLAKGTWRIARWLKAATSGRLPPSPKWKLSVKVMFRISVIWQPLEPDPFDEEWTSAFESTGWLSRNNRETVVRSSLPIMPLRSLCRRD